MKTLMTSALALGLAAAVTIGAATPGLAGPMMSHSAAVKQAAPSDVSDIRWRGGRSWGPGIGLGLAAGAFIGAAVAARPYYYAPDYYEAPVYAEPYAYEPAPQYYAPAPYYYGGRRCFTDEGYGRRRPCSAN